MSLHHECAIQAALIVLLSLEDRCRTLAVVAAIKILRAGLEKEGS